MPFLVWKNSPSILLIVTPTDPLVKIFLIHPSHLPQSLSFVVTECKISKRNIGGGTCYRSSKGNFFPLSCLQNDQAKKATDLPSPRHHLPSELRDEQCMLLTSLLFRTRPVLCLVLVSVTSLSLQRHETRKTGALHTKLTLRYA
jgi:hypothetical protein